MILETANFIGFILYVLHIGGIIAIYTLICWILHIITGIKTTTLLLLPILICIGLIKGFKEGIDKNKWD